MRTLVVLAVFGSMVLAPAIGQAIAAVDLVLAVAIGVACTSARGGVSPAKRLLVACAPWFWLILLGSVVSLLFVGITAWALDTLVRDAFSFAIFFAVLELARRSERVVEAGLTAALVAVVVLATIIVATGSTYRPAGTFANPNYAGHFLALGAALVFLAGRRPLAVRLAVVALAGLAVASTGSFGSASMLLAGACVTMLHRVRYDRRTGVRLVFAALLVLFGLSTWKAFSAVAETNLALGPSINAYRLENTSKVREELWSSAVRLVPEHPLGVGPYGIKTRELLGRDVEVHNELLAYLVERSVIGLAGLIGLSAVLWRHAPRGGAARVLLVMFMVGGVFRETLHFRHAWIFLALAYAHDLARRAEDEAPEPAVTAAR